MGDYWESTLDEKKYHFLLVNSESFWSSEVNDIRVKIMVIIPPLPSVGILLLYDPPGSLFASRINQKKLRYEI